MGRRSRGISERYIGFRIPNSVYEAIENEADQQGIKKAEIIRRALNAYYCDIGELESKNDITSLNELKQYLINIETSLKKLELMSENLKAREIRVSEMIRKIEGIIAEQINKVFGM